MRPLVDAGLLVFFLILLVVSNVSIAVSQISLAVALAMLLARWLLGTAPTRTGLEWPALLLAGWALAMIPFSTTPGESMIFYRRFFLFSALWIGATAVTGPRARRWALAALLTGALGICLYGQILELRETGDLFSERRGDMSNPMTSGALLMMVLLVAAGQLVARGQSLRLRAVVGLVALPILLGLVLTMTRSAWLGFIAGLVAILVMGRAGRGMMMAFLAGVVLLLIPMVFDELLPDILGGRFRIEYYLTGRSTTERVEMWQGGLEIIRQNPITGVGDCDLKAIAPQYYGKADTEYYGHLHNNPVMFGVIWGVPGFILVMVFLWGQLGRLLLRWGRLTRIAGQVRPDDPVLGGWVLGGLGVWVGFGVAGLGEWYFGDAETMVLYLAIIGVALASAKVGPPRVAAVSRREEHPSGDDHV